MPKSVRHPSSPGETHRSPKRRLAPGRRSPNCILFTPALDADLEERLLRAESRQIAATLAAIGIRERSERLAREYRAAAAAEAAAAARVRELQREVLKEQRSRTKMRGPRPHPSPLSPVHASLLWRVVGLGPRKAVSRVGAPPSRRPRRRLSLPLALSTARRKLRRTASL